MKSILTFLFATLSVHTYADLLGSIAPDFSLQDQNATTVDLKSYRKKYVILEWYNEGCPFVRKHYDTNNMQKTQEYAFSQLRDNLVWLSIVSSAEGKQGYLKGPEAAKQKLTAEGSKASHLLLDHTGEVGRAYQAKTTPQIVIVSPEGKVIYTGAIDSIASADKSDIERAQNYVKMAIDDIVNKKSITHPKSKPYGCSVKY